MVLVYSTLTALPVAGSVSVNEHDMALVVTEKVTTPFKPGATPNEVQVLLEIVTASEATVEIVTIPLIALFNATLGKVP
jgi:hypothetical protein